MDDLVLTVETGAIGGVPAGGLSFGALVHAYGVDRRAVHVRLLRRRRPSTSPAWVPPRLTRRATSTSAVSVVSCPALAVSSTSARTPSESSSAARFTAGGLAVTIDRTVPCISGRKAGSRSSSGRSSKSPSTAPWPRPPGRPVLYVTERAVFTLTPDGLTLTELAPGVDLERDVLAQMAFRPRIEAPLRPMAPRLFHPQPMRLAAV